MGKEILELEAFCAINIVAVRQILIRYDAFARANEGTPMMQYYMKLIKSTRSATSFRKILRHEEVLALGDSFLQFLQRSHNNHSNNNHNIVNPDYYLYILHRFQKEEKEIQAVVASSEHAEATSSLGHAPLQDTLLDSLRYYFLMGMLEDRLGYEPSYLTTRGRSLTDEMRSLAQWRRRSNQQWARGGGLDPTGVSFVGCLTSGALIATISEDPWEEEYVEDETEHDPSKNQANEESEELSYQQMFNLFMALTAGFFYCMNYYIVEPSSTMYVNALGAQDAMSATLIGMMPIASFMAAIAYSIWTNRSFRHPFMVSCVLMLTGNIIYSAAFNFKSLPMALAGRFMTGCESP
jgi:hypothetical protein